MDLLGNLAHVTLCTGDVLPPADGDRYNRQLKPFSPAFLRRAEHHPNTGHTTNIRVRLQQENIATGSKEFKLHFCIWFPLSVRTLIHTFPQKNPSIIRNNSVHFRSQSQILSTQWNLEYILYILWSTVALEAKNFVAMALVLVVRERLSLCKVPCISMHLRTVFTRSQTFWL